MAQSDEYGPIEELLPFYVNGTASSADRARVDAALTESPGLRAKLVEEQALATLISKGGAATVAGMKADENRLSAVLGRIDSTTTSGRTAASFAASPRDTSPLAGLLSVLNPRNWHPAVSLALALAAVLQGAYFLTQNSRDEYQVAGGSGEPAGDGGLVIIRLTETARWSDVEALLDDSNLTIVAGPSEGRLTLRSAASNADVDRLVEHLRQSPAIAFAGKAK